MNIHLRLLSKDEAHAVYKNCLKRDFPFDEVKPWKSIDRMWVAGEYLAVGLFEDMGQLPPGVDPLAALRGYAFFVEPAECGACLLDYFAVLPDYRSAGLGSEALKGLRDFCLARGRYILIETEDIDYAKTDAEIEERTRRDAFYERNGCVRTDVKGSVFTVKYAVWTLGLEENDFEQACADMRTLYRHMVPGDKFHKFVKIQRS